MEGKGGGLLTESNRRRNGSNAEANKAHLGNGTLCRTGNFVPLPIRAPSQSKDQRVEAPPIMSSAVAAFARQRSGSTGVPFLEPPLPVTTRLRPIIRLQRWWRDRRGEFPSFLASLVLHITVIIFVASLMPQPRPGVAVGPLIITLVDEEQSVEATLETPGGYPLTVATTLSAVQKIAAGEAAELSLLARPADAGRAL